MEFTCKKVKIPKYASKKNLHKLTYFHIYPNRWSYTVTKNNSGLVIIFYHSFPQQERPRVEQTKVQNSQMTLKL